MVQNWVHLTLFEVILLYFSSSQVTSLTCYRCGTLTPPSGPGRSNDLPPDQPPGGQQPLQNSNGGVVEVDILQLESCSEFEKSSTPKYLYEVTCAQEGQVCAKIVTFSTTYEGIDGKEDEFPEAFKQKRSVQRGCAAGMVANGYRHSLDCGFLQSPPENVTLQNLTDFDHICYCDSNYCNFSSILKSNSILLIVVAYAWIWVQFTQNLI